MRVQQHEFFVSEGQVICRFCGVSREKRLEEPCDVREVPDPVPSAMPAASSSAGPSSTVTAPQAVQAQPSSPVVQDDSDFPMKLVQIPSIGSKTVKKQAYIGVIDASGSMSSYWKDIATMYNQYMPKRNLITITFDATPRICTTNTLSSKLNDHGGGMTNIIKAFNVMDEQIAKQDQDTHIVVLFVSDGEDNQNDNEATFQKRLRELRGNQGRSVTFLCLGVQNKFPTFISMQLREHYHNTQSTIPALFLVEYASEKAFFNKFESMKPFFTSIEKRTVSPAVLVTPWDPLQSTVYEGTWVTSVARELITVDGAPILFTKDQFSSKAVAELFRGYVQELEMLSVTKDSALKDKAALALVQMHKVLDILKTYTGLDVFSDATNDSDGWQGFRHRALNNELLHRKFWIRSYVENVKLTAQGVGAADLNEWDAAKRIGIGTLVGKHQQRALGAKGLTVEMFNDIKRDFGVVLASTKLSGHASGQEGSAITLQNQKEVFAEPDFASGLMYVNSQFDLVEAFPIVGLPLKVKRPDGTLDNPWLIQVKLIARTAKAIDSLSMIKMEGTDRSYRIVLPIGDGQTEEVNAVLPLFTAEDRDMAALIAHPLFHLLMTFNATLGLDAILSDAYLALLAAALVHLLPMPDSTWRTDLLKRISATTNLVYGSGNTEYLTYQRMLVADPAGATSGDENDPSKGNLSQPLFHLFMLYHSGMLVGSDCDAILAHLFIQYYRKYIAADALSAIIELAETRDLVSTVIDSSKWDFQTVYTLREVKEAVQKRTADLLEARISNETAVRIKKEKLEDPESTKVTLAHLNALYRMCHNNEEPSNAQHLKWVYLAYRRSQNDADAMRSIKCDLPTNQIAAELGKIVSPALLANISGEASFEVCAAFTKWFSAVHQTVLPMSYTELKKQCTQKGIDISTLIYDQQTGFVKNACLSPDCPFYLKAKPNVGHHLGAWGSKLPNAFHKTVRKYVDRHPQFILAMFLQQTEARSFDGKKKSAASSSSAPTAPQPPKQSGKTSKHQLVLAEFDATEESVLKYIGMVLDAYQRIAVEDKDVVIPKQADSDAGHQKSKNDKGAQAHKGSRRWRKNQNAKKK